MGERPSQNLSLWERKAEWPLLALSFVFLAAYAAPIVNPDLDPQLVAWSSFTQNMIWAVFALDLAVRFLLAPQRSSFARSHVIDIVAVMLPALRSLRLLRLVSVVTLFSRRAAEASSFRVRFTTQTIATVLLLWLVASLAITEAERNSGGTIQDFGDGSWWAITTMTTVGYGDAFPVTTTGRLIGVGLMLTGIALLGVVTASIAAWFVERFKSAEAQVARDSDAIHLLTKEVQQLRNQLALLQRPLDERPNH